MRFIAEDRDSGCDTKIEADTIKEAREEAKDWLRRGWDNESLETEWGDVYLAQYPEKDEDEGDEEEEDLDWKRLTVDIPPTEPDCANRWEQSREHDWQSPQWLGGLEENPGVWGHGGGITALEVCANCGLYRHTNTWAQRPDTGEQGLESIEYQEADERSTEWVRELEND
jgi:hypothetical protein